MEIDIIARELISDCCMFLGNAGHLKILHLFNGTIPNARHLKNKDFFRSIGIGSNLVEATRCGSYHTKKINLTNDETNYYDKFDFVINNALTQNFKSQSEAFRNIHYFTREGGVMLHILFKEGGWIGRSGYLYKPSFFKCLSKLNGYELEEIEIRDMKLGQILYAILIKKEDRMFNFNFELGTRTVANIKMDEY